MYKAVCEFARAAGDEVPDHPSAMSAKEVDFVCRMVVDELLELQATVAPADLAKSKMLEFVRDAKSLPQEPEPTVESQSDALLDSVYYLYHAAAKRGLNLDAVFEEVHAANMRKADPATGKFLRRASDGKILKPEGWVGPDVRRALYRDEEDEEGEGGREVLGAVARELAVAVLMTAVWALVSKFLS